MQHLLRFTASLPQIDGLLICYKDVLDQAINARRIDSCTAGVANLWHMRPVWRIAWFEVAHCFGL